MVWKAEIKKMQNDKKNCWRSLEERKEWKKWEKEESKQKNNKGRYNGREEIEWRSH